MSDQIVLEAKSVSKFFGTITALDNVNLQLNKGEVLGVVGDSCQDLTKSIEEKLGEVTYVETKPEYYQQENVTLQHNQNKTQEQTTTS